MAGAPLSDPGYYALLGMATMWSGVSRLPITVALVALETTMEMSYLPGVIVVTVLATIVGNFFGESMYHIEIAAKNLPLLPSTTPPFLLGRKISDFMIPVDRLITLQRTEKLSSLVSKLRANRGTSFPVVKPVDCSKPELGCRVCGLVLKESIQHKVFKTRKVGLEDIQELEQMTQEADFSDKEYDSASCSSFEDLPNTSIPLSDIKHTVTSIPLSDVKAKDMEGTSEYPSLSLFPDDNRFLDIQSAVRRAGSISGMSTWSAKSSSISKLQLAIDDLVGKGQLDIDITDMMNNSPCCISEKHSATKAYSMFKHLTLRHMLVVDDSGVLKGLVVRNSFLEEKPPQKSRSEHGTGTAETQIQVIPPHSASQFTKDESMTVQISSRSDLIAVRNK